MSQLGRLDCRIPPSILLRKRLEKENHLPFDRCVITDHSGASGRIVEHHSLPNYQVVFEPFLCDPGGPSYEFFAKLLPPLRYVDARYRYYPIVLAAPRSLVKGKIVSNGSILNPLAQRYIWLGEAGTPWHVLVGNRLTPFGENLRKLTGPHYVDGFLPIVQLEYAGDYGSYREEVFPATDPELASVGALFVRLDFPGAGLGPHQSRHGKRKRIANRRRQATRGS